MADDAHKASQPEGDGVPTLDDLGRAAEEIEANRNGEAGDVEGPKDDDVPEDGEGEPDDGSEPSPEDGPEPSDADEEDDVPPEPDDKTPEGHAERSRLGREVAGQGALIQSMFTQIQSLTNAINSMNSSPQNRGASEREEEDEFDPDAPLTARTLPKYVEKQTKAAREADNSYQTTFLSSLADMSSNENEDTFDKVLDAIDANPEFNQRVTGDARVDAQINYLKAKTHVLSEQGTAPKNPLDKNKGKKKGSSVAAGNRNKGNSVPPMKVSKAAQEYLRYARKKGKLTDEEVEAALSGDGPRTVG